MLVCRTGGGIDWSADRTGFILSFSPTSQLPSVRTWRGIVRTDGHRAGGGSAARRFFFGYLPERGRGAINSRPFFHVVGREPAPVPSLAALRPSGWLRCNLWPRGELACARLSASTPFTNRWPLHCEPSFVRGPISLLFFLFSFVFFCFFLRGFLRPFTPLTSCALTRVGAAYMMRWSARA